ncbi:hypothetical protein [Hymenobacter chitinivorans]|uniref:Uncharacterized protein n=1 Tax=Hymenobacter chitinivorans DSM 11115 TaxID=1121954 RepID=A0A2M9BSE2_9BACT|nr:hypothetical protein [Hymenobacter chitinivorans]PJJ60874.1 hypothetical protein CLV45_2308 [Hymenobacter chitinivorans DSM 11115]
MKYRRLILSAVYGVMLQAILALLTAPFLLLWGAQPAWWQQVLLFVLTYPVPVRLLPESWTLPVILLNGAYWGMLGYSVVRVLRTLWRELKPRLH